jgi:hypothetical protein
MEQMSKEEKRKVEKDIKLKKKIEADLEPERILQNEIDLIKRKVLPGMPDVYIERMRGHVVLEGKEED